MKSGTKAGPKSGTKVGAKPRERDGTPQTTGGARPKAAFKTIQKTEALLKSNEQAKREGKGKEREVLGGMHDLMKANRNLPGAVQIEKFAETRALEIAALQNAVKAAGLQSSSRAFQSLPRHLRRRAASHNPRRVPKRMRSRAAAEIDPGDMTVKMHRKKAKLRAKGNRLGLSRTMQLRGRQVNKKWLGTHLFHAKRFHMTNIWGYRLPETPTLKSFRPSYRAARRQAIVQDTSFMGVMELEGPYDALVSLLGKVTAGSAFTGNKFDTGAYTANVNAYHYGTFPLGLIGEIEILWQPPSGEHRRRLWIRAHPSIFEELWETLSSALESEEYESIALGDRRRYLDSFDIVGPLAGHVLLRTLQICKSEHGMKRNAVEHLLKSDPAECPPGLVVGLKVQDPRLSFPPPALPSSGESCDNPVSVLASEGGAASTLWNVATRQGPGGPRFKKSELDMRRNRKGVPGTRLRPTSEDDRVPVILIKRTMGGGGESAAFHGYTLMIPVGWSMPFLASFIYCNARLGGLAERRVRCREAGRPSFPEHYSATCQAGGAWEAQKAGHEEFRWLRKPPGRRPEYSVLGTEWPFRPDWPAIIENGASATTEETSMNGDEHIQPWLIDSTLTPYLSHIVNAASPAATLLSAVNLFRRRRGLSELPSSVATQLFKTAVCHVQFNTLGRGSPSDMAMVCEVDVDERQRWIASRDADTLSFTTADTIQEVKPDSGSEGLFGFVLSGNISLTRGHGHGIGMVTLAGYTRAAGTATAVGDPDTLVVKTRNADGRVFRYAAMSLVV